MKVVLVYAAGCSFSVTATLKVHLYKYGSSRHDAILISIRTVAHAETQSRVREHQERALCLYALRSFQQGALHTWCPCTPVNRHHHGDMVATLFSKACTCPEQVVDGPYTCTCDMACAQHQPVGHACYHSHCPLEQHVCVATEPACNHGNCMLPQAHSMCCETHVYCPHAFAYHIADDTQCRRECYHAWTCLTKLGTQKT